jgi:hypothetical protein
VLDADFFGENQTVLPHFGLFMYFSFLRDFASFYTPLQIFGNSSLPKTIDFIIIFIMKPVHVNHKIHEIFGIKINNNVLEIQFFA